MASSLPFAFDVEKLNNFVNGDIGIADTIHSATVTPILAKIPTQKVKDLFTKQSAPDKTTGLWAIERTIVSSMLESQKPFIELAKICLELFAGLEYVIATLTGGPNPLNDPNSFSGALAANQSKMAAFKTGLEPNAPSPGPVPVPPQTIFLGKWKRDQPTGAVYSENAQPSNGEFTLGRDWPQYKSFDEFNQDEHDKLQPKIASLDAETQQNINDGRFSSISDEWDEMGKENQLTKNHKDVTPPNLLLFYRPITATYNGQSIEIDPETDYNITITKTTVDHLYDLTNPYYYDEFYISATIKPDASTQPPPPPQSATKASPDPLPGGLIFLTVRAFFKRVFPVIIAKLIPVITAFSELMSNPVKFIGDIMMSKLKEHFVMFDPALKSKPAEDPTRKKYWSGDKFVLDGVASIDAGLMKITLGLKDGLPTFKVGSTQPGPNVKEQPILKQVANIVALPINLLKGILDEFKSLLKNLFNIPKLPGVVSDFITFKWIKDLLSLPSLLKFLGANGNLNDGTFKIPFLDIPSAGAVEAVPQMIKAFLKMIVAFLNGFIQIPNTILNVQLVPPIPVPG